MSGLSLEICLKSIILSVSWKTTPVFFNRGSAEPKGSASICQGFRGWSVKKFKNNLACEIMSNQAIKVTVAPYAPIMLSFKLAPLTVYFSMQCW